MSASDEIEISINQDYLCEILTKAARRRNFNNFPPRHPADQEKLNVTTDNSLYSQFFNNEKHSDFTLKCSDGVELPVHRIVLDANSPVFSKMFATEMEEKMSSKVILKDISSKSMKAALEFIYTRNYSFSDVESTIKILYVAEKYEIEELKKLCINELMGKVSDENVVEIFETADLYNAVLLEKKCLLLIIRRYEMLKGTEKYRQLERRLISKITDEFSRTLGF